MAWRPSLPGGQPRHGVLGRYLLDGERILTAVHQHWAKVAEPVASVVAGLVLAILLDSSLPSGLSLVHNLLWWAWFALVARASWKILEWRHDWFVATDKRLVLTNGLITQKVAMMPLAKVTDMSYNRSPLGRLLGYGTFVMESAGQEQALHSVNWVANPDHTYRAICAEIFGVDDHERVVDDPERGDHDPRFKNGPPSHPPVPYAGYVPPTGHSGLPLPTGTSDTSDHSTAIRIRPSGSRPQGGDAASQEDDIPATNVHEGDTGPIPYWRTGRDDGITP